VKLQCEQTKLERAEAIAQVLEPVQRTMWSSIWPHAHCFVTALTSAPLIRAPLEWDVRVIVGVVYKRPHAWLGSPDHDIIDQTYVFDGGPHLRVLTAARAEELGHVSLVTLTLEQEALYRAAIRPSCQDGWDPAVKVHTLFGINPHVSSALKLQR
jgi:hypothetical protein